MQRRQTNAFRRGRRRKQSQPEQQDDTGRRTEGKCANMFQRMSTTVTTRNFDLDVSNPALVVKQSYATGRQWKSTSPPDCVPELRK